MRGFLQELRITEKTPSRICCNTRTNGEMAEKNSEDFLGRIWGGILV